MLISKRSRRKSDLFDSKFKDCSGVDFPLRQYLRCREEFAGGVVHLILLAAFILTVIYFGRTINQLFLVHGTDLHAAYRWASLMAIGLFALSIGRRLWLKIRELREIKAEMVQLKSELRMRKD